MEVTKIPRDVSVKGTSKGYRITLLYYEWDVHGGVVGSPPLFNDLHPGWDSRSAADAIA